MPRCWTASTTSDSRLSARSLKSGVSHEPIQFGPRPAGEAGDATRRVPTEPPVSLDLKKDEALTLTWSDGRVDRLPIALLRRHSPSADNESSDEAAAANPLRVLSAAPVSADQLRATHAELVGRYALRIEFSDGHRTGLYDWPLLRRLGDRAAD